jgi:ribosomal-protein-alanine N-acetyltransferase
MEDVAEVMELEKLCFLQDPWAEEDYIENLKEPDNFYWFVRPTNTNHWPGIPPIIACGGYHLEETSTHITTLATHPTWRRRRIGEWLLLNMLMMSRNAGAKLAYLEVREDNTAAIRMYLKLGFLLVNKLEHFYRNNSVAAYLLVLYGLDRANVWQPFHRALNSIVIDLTQLNLVD